MVHKDVIVIFSDYQTNASITELRSQIRLSPLERELKFICYPYSEFDRVCMRAGEEEFPFVFLYKTMFKELELTLPFSVFHCSVLSALHIAPTQLHPNSWAFVRASEVQCTKLNISPTTTKFFHFYTLRLGKKARWVSLNGRHHNRLFSLFTSSYKHFKKNFFQS